MPAIKLKIDDLVLDHDNPRITHAEGQQEALSKIVKDQKTKLVKLAKSIVEHGMSPENNLLVVRLNQKPVRFYALEGNRRVAVLKILANPAVMSGLEMPDPMKKALERHAKGFKKSRVEPISCFELPSRQDGNYWLDLKHNIGHEGAGVETWKSLAKRRFAGQPPVVQALDLVIEKAGLTSAELASITDKFPATTLERFLQDREVRRALGLDIKDGKLITKLPADEIARPLKKIVLDLATKKKRVGELMKTADMLGYIQSDLGEAHLPDRSKARATARTLDEIPTSEFAKVRSRARRRKPDPSDRTTVVPRNCQIQISDNRISEIYKELRSLKLEGARNAISVLLRVFLELSVDHFLENNGGSLKFTPSGSTKVVFKKLDKKLAEVVGMLVSSGVPQAHFSSITRDLALDKSPMNIELFHRYIHDRFSTPSPSELTAAWDHAQPLFEKIWA